MLDINYIKVHLGTFRSLSMRQIFKILCLILAVNIIIQAGDNSSCNNNGCSLNPIPCNLNLNCSTCGTNGSITGNTCGSNCRVCRTSRDILYCNTGCFTCGTCNNKSKGATCPNGTRTNNTFNNINNNSSTSSTSKDNGCFVNRNKRCSNKCSRECDIPRAIFVPRSQGANTARELSAWQVYNHRANTCGNYFTTASTIGYSRSYRPERIARYLFGDCSLNFAGSQVANRTQCQILADYFGLSTRFQGRLEVNPVIDNIFLDNQIFISLDNIACGFFLKFNAPIVHTRWNLGLCTPNIIEQEENNNTCNDTCSDFPACYMSSNETRSTCNIRQALSGNFTFGDMQERWHFGRFSSCALTKTRLADIDIIAGFDFWRNPIYNLGLYGIFVAPTGNKPTSKYIFEPIVGNGKHWELGVGIEGHLLLWQRDCGQFIAIYLDGHVTHLFKNTQCRSFDFCNKGNLSRYMLLKEFESNESTLSYSGRLINAINFNTRLADVTVAVKGDASVKVTYHSPCTTIDVGYNFYGNSKEKIRLNCHTPCNIDNRKFGFKGTEGVCALEYATVGDAPPVTFGPLVRKTSLNSTQSNATINRAGTTDNPVAVPVLSPDDIAVTALSAQTGVINGPNVIIAQQSNPPVLVTTQDLDIKSAQAGATATHKIFGYIGYNCENINCGYAFYAGLGGELEIDALPCNQRTSLNQWSLWLKGGVAF